jgi:hypothetical protein
MWFSEGWDVWGKIEVMLVRRYKISVKRNRNKFTKFIVQHGNYSYQYVELLKNTKVVNVKHYHKNKTCVRYCIY